jgi:hypothetical protein
MIEFGNLLIDFGLVILVLIVQLVIYPSFNYYSIAKIRIWHPIYTRRFTIIVMPLMMLQLGYSIYFLTVSQNVYPIGNFILILLIWLITFIKAIPLHTNLPSAENLEPLINSLIKWNLWRCILWILIFCWTLGRIIY